MTAVAVGLDANELRRFGWIRVPVAAGDEVIFAASLKPEPRVAVPRGLDAKELVSRRPVMVQPLTVAPAVI